MAIRSLLRFTALGIALTACVAPSASDSPSESPSVSAQRDRLAEIVSHRHAPPPGAMCKDGGLFRCFAQRKVDAAGRPFITPLATGPTDGYEPTDIQSAYNIDTTAQKSVTVGIVDAYGYTNLEADLQVYRNQFGLPTCTTSNGCLKIVNQEGAASPLPADNPGWAGETSLDVQMVSATCPSCKILVVQANDDSSDGLFLAIDTAVSLGATVVSNSWGGPEQDIESYFDISVTSAETHVNHPGTAIFVADGDDGYDDGGDGPDYPGTSAYSIAVGGTNLAQSSSTTRGWTEKAWGSKSSSQDGAGGSSCSVNIAKPSWQTAITSGTACSKRMASDVAAVGDPETGVAVYDSEPDSQEGITAGWSVVGGTSAASPVTATIFASSGNNARTAQFTYQNTTAFYDVTSGSNANGTGCTGKLCTAGTGWDGPTGNGSPNFTALAALGSSGSGSGSGSAGSGSDDGSGSGSGSNDGSGDGSGSNEGSGDGSNDGNGNGNGSSDGSDGDGNGDGNGGGSSGGGGCAVGGGANAATLAIALGFAFIRRRRRA